MITNMVIKGKKSAVKLELRVKARIEVCLFDATTIIISMEARDLPKPAHSNLRQSRKTGSFPELPKLGRFAR
jgi:hypothetical protein